MYWTLYVVWWDEVVPCKCLSILSYFWWNWKRQLLFFFKQRNTLQVVQNIVLLNLLFGCLQLCCAPSWTAGRCLAFLVHRTSAGSGFLLPSSKPITYSSSSESVEILFSALLFWWTRFSPNLSLNVLNCGISLAGTPLPFLKALISSHEFTMAKSIKCILTVHFLVLALEGQEDGILSASRHLPCLVVQIDHFWLFHLNIFFSALLF